MNANVRSFIVFIYIKKKYQEFHFCYLDIALGYHVNNIEIHQFIKKYFYKKCFLVLSDDSCGAEGGDS